MKLLIKEKNPIFVLRIYLLEIFFEYETSEIYIKTNETNSANALRINDALVWSFVNEAVVKPLKVQLVIK